MSISQLHNFISNIITTLTGAVEMCESAANASSLPQPIQDLVTQLPWIRATFEKAKEGFPNNEDPSQDIKSLEDVLQECVENVLSLNVALQDELRHTSASYLEQDEGLPESVPEQAEALMLRDRIFSNLEALAANEAVEEETRDFIRALVHMISGAPGFDLWGVPDSD